MITMWDVIVMITAWQSRFLTVKMDRRIHKFATTAGTARPQEREDFDMYRVDKTVDTAADWIVDYCPDALDAEIRRDLDTEDAANGRLHGYKDVFELLRSGQWPKTGADRDALCRRWEINARTLYQWRRDVLLLFAFARMHWYIMKEITVSVTNAEPEKPQE